MDIDKAVRAYEKCVGEDPRTAYMLGIVIAGGEPAALAIVDEIERRYEQQRQAEKKN